LNLFRLVELVCIGWTCSDLLNLFGLIELVWIGWTFLDWLNLFRLVELVWIGWTCLDWLNLSLTLEKTMSISSSRYRFRQLYSRYRFRQLQVQVYTGRLSSTRNRSTPVFFKPSAYSLLEIAPNILIKISLPKLRTFYATLWT